MELNQIKEAFIDSDNLLGTDEIIIDDVFEFIEMNSYPMFEMTDRYMDENSYEATREEVETIIEFIRDKGYDQ